jgi:hypothetical protein
MAEIITRSLGDVLKDCFEKIGYSSGMYQRLFGHVPSIEEFVKLTQGEITIQPQLDLVAPLSASNYPFEIYVKYSAVPNGILVPVFSKQIEHYESIERLTEDEYDAIDEDKMSKKLSQIAGHKKLRIELKYSRISAVKIPEL